MVGLSLNEIPRGRVFHQVKFPTHYAFHYYALPRPLGRSLNHLLPRWGFHEQLWPHPGGARRGYMNQTIEWHISKHL